MARRSGEILSQRKRRGATPRTAIPACLRIIVAVLVLGAIAGGAHAQIPDPQPQQPYPLPEQTYPPPVVGAPEFQPQPPAAPVPASASPSSTVRNLFAGALAAVPLLNLLVMTPLGVALPLLQGLGFETGGYWIWSKRLERGRFARLMTRDGRVKRALCATEFLALLEGVDVEIKRQRKRYRTAV